MSRPNVDTNLLTAAARQSLQIGFLAQIQFRSQTSCAWTGAGPLVWNGNTFLGVGSLASVSDIPEGSEVRAEGISLSLSGLDPSWLDECLTDIQLGAPATLWLAFFAGGALAATPYPIFSGTVDKSSHQVAPDTLSVRLSLENRLIQLQRASGRRYTDADQRAYYPDDCGLSFVEALNEIALLWNA